MSKRSIDLGYRPRQPFSVFHTRQSRWSCIVAHRRAGKTVACVMDLIDAALRCPKPSPRYAYVAPLYAQAKDVAWSYLKSFAAQIPDVTTHEAELRVDLPGDRRIRLYGADNYDRLRGIYLDGVVLDEYGDMDPRAYPEVIRPALSDRQGSATFIGTPKGRNAFYELMHGNESWEGAIDADDWFTMTLKASETGLVSAEELLDAQRIMTPEQYQQEYECSFDAAIIGAYYGREIEKLEAQKQIGSVPVEPTLEVYTAWDLGLDDSTAIWFAQIAGREIRIIDYYETNNMSLTEIAKVIRNEKPYVYAAHYLPHDVEIREMMTAKSRKESLESLGISPIVVASRQSVEEGISAARSLLPKCWFDAQRCKQGLESLRQYRRAWDDKKKAFRPTPMHDWASHGADAFRYLAMCLEPKAKKQRLQYSSKGIV